MNSGTSLASHSPSAPVQGDFAVTPAPSLVADLVRQRFSGTLRVERHGAVKVLYLNQGDLACASSNAEEDRLGNLLVRHGRLSAEQLEHAKSKQPEKATIGNVLVELGFITSAELLWGARRQVEEILGDLLGWREGIYLLREMPLSKEVVNLGMPGRALLVRALQKLTDRELVLERLGTLETVLVRQPLFEETARGIDFGFAADEVLAAIDGKHTVREICEASGVDDFQACKVLYTLLTLGAVGHELRPARELIFVEGELQNGEEISRVDESKARRSWLRAAREPAQPLKPAPPPSSSAQPPPAAPEEPVAPAEPAASAEEEGPSEPEAAAERRPEHPPESMPSAGRVRRSGRVGLWAAALAILLLVIGGSLYYVTSMRPTLESDDEVEARLMAALVDELQESGDLEPPVSEAPQPPAQPGMAETGAEKPSGSRPPKPVEPNPDLRIETTSRETDSQLPVAPAPHGAPPALEKPAPLTMLSRDSNFREALDLVRERRIPAAAASFQRALAAQKAGTHTIQLLLACQDSTVEKAFERTPDRTLYFVTTTFSGKTCYRLFDGLYASAAEARTNLASVPAAFLDEGNRPAVVRVPRP